MIALLLTIASVIPTDQVPGASDADKVQFLNWKLQFAQQKITALEQEIATLKAKLTPVTIPAAKPAETLTDADKEEPAKPTGHWVRGFRGRLVWVQDTTVAEAKEAKPVETKVDNAYESKPAAACATGRCRT